MAKLKTKPDIRYAEFTDAWEQRKLGDVGELKNGMNFGKEAMGHGYPFVNLQDIFGRSVIDNSNLGLAESSEIQRKEYSLQKGDVLFIRSSVKPEGVGEAALVPHTFENTTYSGFIIRFRPMQAMDNDFKQVVFSTTNTRSQIMASATSSANTNINQESLQKIRVMLPCLREQAQIGAFYKHLDHLITLHQREHDKTTNIKKALLEKMFPKNGTNIPEIRFAGFTDAWEQRKVSTFSDETYGGGTPKTSKESYWGGELSWIQSSDLTEYEVFGVKPKKKITKLGLQNSATKLIPENSIAIITRVGVGKLALISFEYATSQDFLSLSKLRIDERFAVYSLYKKLQGESYVVQGTSIKGITKDELLNKTIMVPSSQREQIEIGTFFAALDHLITLHQRELKKLQNMKKALLEKMFV